MRITRVYTGDDGESHFEDIEIAFPEAMGLGMRTQHFPADSISMRQASVDSEMDFHIAPRRQFVITVAGRAEMECGDGSKRQLGAGDVLLADDLTGRGHITRTVELPRCSVVVPVPDDFDLDALRA